MHHEILLTLSGCPGDIFTTSRETGLYEIIPDIPLIHPSEVQLVNRLISLGSYYRTLIEFIKHQTSPVVTLTTPTAPCTDEQSGLYLRSLAFGLNKVLESYRNRIVAVEKECIADPHLPLSHMQHSFEEFHFLLPSLDSTVKHIVRSKVHGCKLLSLLYDKTACGIPSVKKAYESLLQSCHGVLYKQLSSWMIYGLLKDDYNEFFITLDATTIHDEEGKGENEREEREIEGQKQGEGPIKYQINPQLLPSYLPMRVAEKILFVGEALQVLLGHDTKLVSPVNQTSQSARDLRSCQLTFASLLSDLQLKEIFDLRAFESCCSQIRDTIAEHLWLLLVEEADLLSSLQTVKEYYLLGRGELFLTFIDTADSFMKLPPSTATQHDVNVAFKQAMTTLSIEVDDNFLLHQLSLTLPSTDKKLLTGTGGSTVKSSWDQLGMSFKPKWPLHILFTSNVLQKYDKLFRVLLAIRRAQISLKRTWYLQMSNHQRPSGLLWQLRVHMSFLIDNLQYYVQVDVLETQFTRLIDKINSTHDFESIKHAHDVYLNTLLTQLFTGLHPVSQGLHDIMELCHQLYNIVQTVSDPPNIKDNETIERIAKSFSRQASLLFRILSNVRTTQLSPHLAQLLLRIDYNKFFSSHSSLITFPSSSLLKT